MADTDQSKPNPPAMRLRDHPSAQLDISPEQFSNLVDRVLAEIERRMQDRHDQGAPPPYEEPPPDQPPVDDTLPLEPSKA